MLITAVGTPGSGQTHAFRVRHGMNPHVELWRHGLVVREYLSADRVDDEIVVTATSRLERLALSLPAPERACRISPRTDKPTNQFVRTNALRPTPLYGHGGDYWVPSARHAPQSLACGRYLEVV
ncbi:hypothetical protein JCM18918_2083 [Cutibacterium acnes JCM 18918]|nr:hypothetical protein JCM18918_2083 [Cutibacterium acnes JCM 18918]